MPSTQPSITTSFENYFRMQLVQSEEQLHLVQHLRYRVYCQEFGYENPEAFSNEREVDEFDEQSVHCLVMHRATGQAAGCVRVVPASNIDNGSMLPMEKYCKDALHPTYIHKLNQDRSTSCEISRLAVDGDFRRRGPEEKKSRFGKIAKIDFSPEEVRTLPLVAVSAFLAASAIADVTGYTNGFAMMEPFLPRLMSRSGISFERAGQDIDYHGTRAPYFTTTDATLEGMQTSLKDLYNTIRAQLYPGLESHRLH